MPSATESFYQQGEAPMLPPPLLDFDVAHQSREGKLWPRIGGRIPDGHLYRGGAQIGAAASTLQSISTSDDAELRREFRDLAERWHQATDHLSTTIHILADRSYRQLLLRGSAILPLIFEDMEERSGEWFEALELITHENPARHAQSRREARDAWLTWWRRKHHGLR